MINIYEFTDSILLLETIYASSKNIDPSMTVRKWASTLEIDSPDLLIKIFKRERGLPLGLLHPISEALNLNREQTLYLKLLIIAQKHFSLEELRTLIQSLQHLDGKDNT